MSVCVLSVIAPYQLFESFAQKVTPQPKAVVVAPYPIFEVAAIAPVFTVAIGYDDAAVAVNALFEEIPHVPRTLFHVLEPLPVRVEALSARVKVSINARIAVRPD